MKSKHSLWQQLCGRHGWIYIEYALYKDGVAALIVGQSEYGNGLAFKQTYTSLDGMWKLMILACFESTFSLLIISFKVKIKVYMERAMVKTYIYILLWLKSDKQ